MGGFRVWVLGFRDHLPDDLVAKDLQCCHGVCKCRRTCAEVRCNILRDFDDMLCQQVIQAPKRHIQYKGHAGLLVSTVVKYWEP